MRRVHGYIGIRGMVSTQPPVVSWRLAPHWSKPSSLLGTTMVWPGHSPLLQQCCCYACSLLGEKHRATSDVAPLWTPPVAVEHHFHFTISHIAGTDNGPVDSLSHNQVSLFHTQVPQVPLVPETLPEDLVQLFLAENPLDWLSDSWRLQLVSILA